MEGWKGGRLEIVERGEHEVLMEVEAMREPVYDGLEKLFLATVTS
jgi:lysophospholipase